MMRKSVTLFVVGLMVFVGTPLWSQQSSTSSSSGGEQIVVNTNDLPPSLVEELRQKEQLAEIDQKVSTYTRWGHEIGTAMDEGLSAITRHTADFAETDLGRFTMFLIAWKVMSEDIISVGGGTLKWVIWFGVFVCFSLGLLWSYRKTVIPRRILVEKTRTGFWNKTKKYELYIPNSDVERPKGFFDRWPRETWAVLHAVLFVLLLLFSTCASCNVTLQ